MAVPPKATKIIAEAVLKTFAGIEYSFVKPKWTFDELVHEGKVPYTV